LKIEEVRTSFTVYLIASELNRIEGIGESLGLAGYMVAGFGELTAAFSEFPSNPPHFVLFDALESQFDLAKAIQQVSVQLPESHIFLVTPLERRSVAAKFLEAGVYDLIYTPLESQTELIRALDRAAERDYFMYLNERLSEEAQDLDEISTESTTHPAEPKEAAEPAIHDGHLDYARRLFVKKTPDECLQHFMRSASAALDNCGIAYFKYIANRRVLMAAQSEGVHVEEFASVGVNFNEEDTQFKSSSLREPMEIKSLTDMVASVFGTQDFFLRTIDALGEIQGVLVFLHSPLEEANDRVLDAWILLLIKALNLLEADRRLHVTAIKDAGTDLLNRPNFIHRIQEEVSRSRRTSLPASLLIIAIDQYGQIFSQMGAEEASLIMRMVARILEKHSRTNDIVGRTGADEFGVLLPHTGHRGAMIKAERLRKTLQSADFTKVLKAFPHLTISVGVSEYPSHVRDADELMQSADEALYQVRQIGNKTCLSQPPENFKPDFVVDEKGAS
jgi:diguanylate cyclase (GGDEF)-like protein